MEPASKIPISTVAPKLEVVGGPRTPAQAVAQPANWLIGFSSYTVFAWLYDFPLYAFVMWHLGPVLGGLVMTLLTIPVDLYCFRLYDWSEQDWLAIEYIKKQKNYEGNNFLRRFVKFVLTRTPIPFQILILSGKFNAFIITALLREGAYQFNGLTRRDWKIFWFSFLTTQLYWIVVVAAGVESFQWLLGK